jgi:hypothetical protein
VSKYFSRKRAGVKSVSRKELSKRAMALALASGVILPATGWTTEEQVVANPPQSESITYFGIYKDPVTGKFGPPPADVTGNPPLDLSTIQPSLSTSSEGLKEEFAVKGKMVRLNGGFQDVTTVTIDASGNIVPLPSTLNTVPNESVVTSTQEGKE